MLKPVVDVLCIGFTLRQMCFVCKTIGELTLNSKVNDEAKDIFDTKMSKAKVCLPLKKPNKWA